MFRIIWLKTKKITAEYGPDYLIIKNGKKEGWDDSHIDYRYEWSATKCNGTLSKVIKFECTMILFAKSI